MPQRVFIVEDEAYVRDEIKYMLAAYDQLEIVGEADNSLDAICCIQELKPDVAFLDIKLGDIDGITLAKKIVAILPDIRLVFVTAFDSYAVAGFELNAVDYVLKPFSEERLAKTVERLQRDLPAENATPGPEKGNDRLIVKKNHVWKLIEIADIHYFQSQDHATLAVTEDDAYTLDYTLRELEAQLRPDRFLRTHKSFIVNLDRVHEIIPWFNYTYKIRLKNRSDELPVSRSYIKKFKAALHLG